MNPQELFEEALATDGVLGSGKRGPVVRRAVVRMRGGGELLRTVCQCGGSWPGHAWSPDRKEWATHLKQGQHIRWVAALTATPLQAAKVSSVHLPARTERPQQQDPPGLAAAAAAHEQQEGEARAQLDAGVLACGGCGG